jgi:hypothetical protein
MVDLMSRWPIQFCSVRMSTPCRKCSVAKVWRNLCRKKWWQYGPSAHLFLCLVTHCQHGALGYALNDHVVFTIRIAF